MERFIDLAQRLFSRQRKSIRGKGRGSKDQTHKSCWLCKERHLKHRLKKNLKNNPKKSKVWV